MTKKLTCVAAVAILMAAVFGGCAKKTPGTEAAKVDYPRKGKTITFICPWTAGGGTDAVLRAFAVAAEKQLGATIIVENRTGGGGVIGHSAIKTGKPDGYTVGMVTWALSAYKAQGLADFTYADYDPVCRLNADASALTVNAKAPFNTVGEFVAYCKEHPGEVTIGNASPGGEWHVAAGLFASEAGIDVKHVPFEGAAPAVTALAGGHITATAVSLAEVKSQLDAGNVKCLGIMDTERSKLYPNIPTFTEEGYPIVAGTWRGMVLPKGVDPAIKAILVKAFAAAAQDPDFIATAERLNLKLAYLGPEDFAAFMKEDLEKATHTLIETHLLDE